MDRYVLLVSLHQSEACSEDGQGLDAAQQFYDFLKRSVGDVFPNRPSLLPACSLTGSPAAHRWCFAIQAHSGVSQFCSSDWEDLGPNCSKSDSEEATPSAMDVCRNALGEQHRSDPSNSQSILEMYEEAAEGLHLLADKFPAPGKALLDIILLTSDKAAPALKEFLPVLGSLKHMQAWHSAKITVVTDNRAGWQKVASYLSAGMCDTADLLTCIDGKELWRGGVLIQEKKFASELHFGGFCLKERPRDTWSALLSGNTADWSHMEKKHPAEVFQYYQSSVYLVQVVSLCDLPPFLHSPVEFELTLTTQSVQSKLLLDQLRTLRGQVGVLFSLSCTVSTLAVPPAPQRSSHKWKEYMAKRPKTLPVPGLEVKGETGQYFLLVQGSDTGVCIARLIHSANQINGAAAMATFNGLLKDKSEVPSGESTTEWLQSLPGLHGNQLMRRERKLARVQALALKECLRRRKEAQSPAMLPASELKALLSLAREQYLHMHDRHMPRAVNLIAKEKENHSSKAQEMDSSMWPERSVLQNFENQMKNCQRRGSSLLLSGGSSESLLGPKEIQKPISSILDAKELLRHFTPEGLPSGELHPLPLHRGEHPFQLTADMTPRKVIHLPFTKACDSHYHGIEFCLDEQRALERDRGLARLQSRLVRYETQSTCCREPCPIPMTLSPVPSPALMSEPGSVPDGEALLSCDPPRLKRRSQESERAQHTHKRMVKSESSESLGSQCSSSSGSHSARASIRQQQTQRVQPTSTARQQQPHTGEPAKESRSQKHHRMLKEVVATTLSQHGVNAEHKSFSDCSRRLFEISKFYLKEALPSACRFMLNAGQHFINVASLQDLKTSRGLYEEMKKAAGSNAKQVIDWVVEKTSNK